MTSSSKGTVTRWRRYLGDTDSIQLQLNGIDSIMQGAQATAKVVRNGAATSLPASVIDSVNKIVSVTLTTWLADPGTATGVYTLRVTLDDVTWPEVGEAQIEVASVP
jgi:hypothetical protein